MTAGYQPYPSFDADPTWDAEHPISVYGKIFSKKVCDGTQFTTRMPLCNTQ